MNDIANQVDAGRGESPAHLSWLDSTTAGTSGSTDRTAVTSATLTVYVSTASETGFANVACVLSYATPIDVEVRRGLAALKAS